MNIAESFIHSIHFQQFSIWQSSKRFGISLAIGLALFLSPFISKAHPTEPAQAAPFSPVTLACEPFTQVNASAFGMGTGADTSYSSEEGFEVLEFNGQLYLGMEADNSYGARIWRSKAGISIPNSQADWEEVAAVNGKPFGVENVTQNDHIDSLAEFNGYIYASTANGGSSTYGTRVFRSSTGASGSWEDAIAAYGAGFGSIDNTNFKDMQVFQGQLCGGTQNWMTGTQVWCTPDGTTWTKKNVSGFGTNYYNNKNTEVWSGAVYNGGLYFGVQYLGTWRSDELDDEAKVYRTTDISGTPVWTEVFSGNPGSRRADILGDLNGEIYLAVRSSGGILVYRSPNGDPGTWSIVSTPGMNGNPSNLETVVDGATVYNGALYLSITNTSTGLEVWRTTGVLQPDGVLVDWEQVDGPGLGDPKNLAAQLISYNGYLYSWVSNYATGQQVRRSECGIEQTLPVSSNILDYTFDSSIGAKVSFTDLGSATQVTVRAYPGAWDPQGMIVGGVKPVKRHYAVSTDGAGYNANIVLSYTDSEYNASTIPNESTTYQALWSGSDWKACPSAQQQRDPGTNTVTCSNVTDLSEMVITGGATPNAVVLANFAAAPQKGDPFTTLLALGASLILGAILVFRRRAILG
jgi:hypothetical protein